VEIWHRDADHWKDLYQKGMRVLVVGRMVERDLDGQRGSAARDLQINARSVGILPFRIESVPSAQDAGTEAADRRPRSPGTQAPKETKRRVIRQGRL
jgi:single-strand DNA-binding protein